MRTLCSTHFHINIYDSIPHDIFSLVSRHCMHQILISCTLITRGHSTHDICTTFTWSVSTHMTGSWSKSLKQLVWPVIEIGTTRAKKWVFFFPISSRSNFLNTKCCNLHVFISWWFWGILERSILIKLNKEKLGHHAASGCKLSFVYFNYISWQVENCRLQITGILVIYAAN